VINLPLYLQKCLALYDRCWFVFAADMK